MTQRPARKLKLKVNRAASDVEAKGLRQAGADLVGFHADDDVLFGIDPNPFWPDGRYVYTSDVDALMESVDRGAAFVEAPLRQFTEDLCRRVSLAGGTFVQTSEYVLPPERVLTACAASGLSLAYGGHYVSPGDERGLTGLAARPWPLLAALDLQIFPSEGDAWALLSNPGDLSGEVIGIADIDGLARQLPVYVSLNTTRSNCRSIRDTFATTAVLGLSLTLSPARHGAFHTVEYEEARAILEILSHRAGQ